jgi:lysophospholipase L1-like esterase
MDKTNDNLNGNNMISTGVGSSDEVVNITNETVKETVKLTNSTESQFTSTSNFMDSNKKRDNVVITKKAAVVTNQIPVIINGRIATKNGENTISLTRHGCNSSISDSGENIIPVIRPITNRVMKTDNKLREEHKHNIIIMGDSHSRGSAVMLRDYLGSKFEVYGIIKPGASAAEIVAQTNKNYRHLTKKDVIVLFGGSNDVYRNNSKTALLQIAKFCEEINRNIIVFDIPHRYDLMGISCVNKEVQAFNRKLRKVTKQYKHVTILEVSRSRETFTQHGLHLNKLGKRQIAQQIATEIKGILQEKIENPICVDCILPTNRNLIMSEMSNAKEQQQHLDNSIQISKSQMDFDCVNHKILIDKLEFYGIEGKFKTLIKSYLTDRHQRVELSNKSNSGGISNWEKIECGVPQGSILGPLFFLFYINDLPKILNKDKYMVLYADDTSLIITDRNNSNFEINLNRTFKKIHTWFSSNLLTLNLKKTQYLNFSSRKSSRSPTHIVCEQGSITTVS